MHYDKMLMESSASLTLKAPDTTIVVCCKIFVITARKRSFRKVMFLHLSVILFTGVAVSVHGGSLSGGLCPGRSLSKGVSVQGGLSVRPPVR